MNGYYIMLAKQVYHTATPYIISRKDNILVGTMHLELANGILYMSVVVFPEYQRRGYATVMLKDIQAGKIGISFNKIEVSVDEKNIASLELFESVGFICTGKDGELFEYEYSKG